MINQNIYQVFIRNHTPEGTIQALIKDIPRITAMGFKFLYLMPFHPISVLNRKGTYGSPYAIADYLGVSEDLGTKDDLKELLDVCHQQGLKVIMDIVFNHCGADNVWTKTHPDYFILDEQGQPTRKVADWSDIVDFDYTNKNLWNDLKNVLIYWAKFGFDAFRCDVANLVPYGFWLEAKSELKGKGLDVYWFSESVDLGFREALLKNHEVVLSDLDILRLFDGSYSYDVWKEQKEAMHNPDFIPQYSALLNYRYGQQIQGKMKWNFVENHDQVRVRANGMSQETYRKWLSFVLFYPGMGFVYAGGESKDQPEASFFEKAPFNMDFDSKLVSLITRCNEIKAQWQSEGEVWAKTLYENNVFKTIVTTRLHDYTLLLNFNDETVEVEISGEVLLNGSPHSVVYDKISLSQEPVIIKSERK